MVLQGEGERGLEQGLARRGRGKKELWSQGGMAERARGGGGVEGGLGRGADPRALDTIWWLHGWVWG